MTRRILLITGATGSQGGATLRELSRRRGDWDLRALVRDPGAVKAQALARQGVTLVRGDLAAIARARALSAATMRNIRQNLFFAFAYNALGVPVAAGVLYPALGLLLSPIIAAAAMALSSVSVIANALRLRAARA